LFTTTGVAKGAPTKTDDKGNNLLVLDDEGHARRSVEEIHMIIKSLFSHQYKTVSS